MKTITLTDIIILKNKVASDPAKDQRLRLFTSEFFPHKSLSQYLGFPISTFSYTLFDWSITKLRNALCKVVIHWSA